MKTITASLFALVLSAPFALADGCGMHGEQEASMSCATGQAWDAEAKQCVDTSALAYLCLTNEATLFVGWILLSSPS